MTPETHLVSFVVRFVCDQASSATTTDAPPARWRGLVRHVQSNEELHFTRWADAVAFIGRFTQLDPTAGQLANLPANPLPRPKD